MGTEGITPEPEALVSSQLAAEVHEIEAKSESAEATPSTLTTGIPGGNVVVEALDSHQFALHMTLNRIIELAPRFFASKEEYAKVRLELGRELHTLQELHAKPGCGDFVERLKALRSKTKISRSTAYALIAEYEIFAGLRRKDPPPPSPKPASSLSEARKDESDTRERGVTIDVDDPTLELELEHSEPALEETESANTNATVQLRIPLSQLEQWDNAIVVLQNRPGYEAANLSQLVLEAVTAYADLARLHQAQAQEEAEKNKQTEANERGGTESVPGEEACA